MNTQDMIEILYDAEDLLRKRIPKENKDGILNDLEKAKKGIDNLIKQVKRV